MEPMALKAVEHSFGYAFKDGGLLRRALTHRSHGAVHNERLEFLGDSVVNCAIALALYQKFSELPEGELSRLRASLVSQPALAALAENLGLSRHLALGEGELKSGGARRPSILSDALEAVLGAVLLDGGFDAACQVVHGIFKCLFRRLDYFIGAYAKHLGVPRRCFYTGRFYHAPLFAVAVRT